jgi:hypothetical protein
MIQTHSRIPGYDYGTERTAHSPLTLEDLHEMEQTVGWTRGDEKALKKAGAVLREQAEAMVDSWRAQIAKQPYLAKWFYGRDGRPDDAYKAAVKKRFVQWVIDTCTRPHDQEWLDYQEEIGLRHTPAKKNEAEHAHTPNVVPFRYLLAFAGPVILGVKEFLARGGASETEVERMHEAWSKSVLLQLALWSRAYVAPDLW